MISQTVFKFIGIELLLHTGLCKSRGGGGGILKRAEIFPGYFTKDARYFEMKKCMMNLLSVSRPGPAAVTSASRTFARLVDLA